MITQLKQKTLSYPKRLEHLREAKLAHTRTKQQIIGAMDYDDWAVIPPPEELRDVVSLIGPSGEPITDILIKGLELESNHESGGYFGAAIVGRNYRRLLESHPVYIDPYGSLAGGYMMNFFSTRQPHWNPELHYDHLVPEQEKYGLVTGIGGVQHLAQELSIGLDLGWRGLLEKIGRYRTTNGSDKKGFYDGLEDVVLGIQNLIGRHAEEARRLAGVQGSEQLRRNMLEMAQINEWLIDSPPRTFREACQWILWYQMAARMYDNSGSLGRLDLYLYPYYKKDVEEGRLTEEEAVFLIAQNLLRVSDYIQLGGYDEQGRDNTNPVSYLVLEAVHQLKIPANVAVAVGKGIDRGLLKRGVEILFEDKLGIPKFLGLDSLYRDYTKNGYTLQEARKRIYNGCHWFAVPGREYGMNDLVKLNFARVFDVALREMLADSTIQPGVEELWDRFEKHLRRAVEVLAEGLDFHLEHMHRVFPELVLDLLCYGTVEKGMDVSQPGALEYVNLCIDGTALATTADSFAALEQRIEEERRLSWQELLQHLDSNWSAADGAKVRAMMKNVPHYGYGGSKGDEYALRIVRSFAGIVSEKPTPKGHKMIPGLFSWASTISMGKHLGATPNGRRAGEPISFGSNPDPGFRKDGALTALAEAVAAVQPGWGNPAPLQIEVDPGFSKEEGGVEKMCTLLETHFELGGTEININILDKQKVLEAHKDPSKYPDLVVRVTGFSAYFASLSPQMREVVVRRIVSS